MRSIKKFSSHGATSRLSIPPLNENIGGDYLVNAEIQKRLTLQETQIEDDIDDEELLDELNGIINE